MKPATHFSVRIKVRHRVGDQESSKRTNKTAASAALDGVDVRDCAAITTTASVRRALKRVVVDAAAARLKVRGHIDALHGLEAACADNRAALVTKLAHVRAGMVTARLLGRRWRRNSGSCGCRLENELIDGEVCERTAGSIGRLAGISEGTRAAHTVIVASGAGRRVALVVRPLLWALRAGPRCSILAEPGHRVLVKSLLNSVIDDPPSRRTSAAGLGAVDAGEGSLRAPTARPLADLVGVIPRWAQGGLRHLLVGAVGAWGSTVSN